MDQEPKGDLVASHERKAEAKGGESVGAQGMGHYVESTGDSRHSLLRRQPLAAVHAQIPSHFPSADTTTVLIVVGVIATAATTRCAAKLCAETIHGTASKLSGYAHS